MYVTIGGRVLRGSDKLRVVESVTDARFRPRASCEVEEDTRTRRAGVKRSKPRARRDRSRRLRQNRRATLVQQYVKIARTR